MHNTIHPAITLLATACILAGFWLPFAGYWQGAIFDLHLLALTGYFGGMSLGYGAALIRDA